MTDATILQRLWAPRAWLADGWRESVLLESDANGRWYTVQAETPRPDGATVLPGPVLPGLVNAHGHAFQRAFAGHAEWRTADGDDFWSWRDRMYRVAMRITPELLETVATQLYIELLAGGYTHMCEFHYLHHAGDGSRYGDPLAMTRALIRAAGKAGIGMTMLPVLYERAGFRHPALRDDQRPFATTPDDVLRMRDTVRAMKLPLVSAGIAVHSLRAASPDSIFELLKGNGSDDGPIHIHAAEQTGEVDDCVAATGARPLEWLAQNVALDARWQLVHATHATPDEIVAVAQSGAGVVLCPSTECNLGDGLSDLPRWLAANGALSIGTDSHVTRDWREELRLLEYGQRLHFRKRNVAAAPEQGSPSSAERLFKCVLADSGAAAGFPAWGLQAGARADLLVVDTDDPALLGLPDAQLLDGLVFSSPVRPWRDVMVGGRWVVREHRHGAADPAAFTAALLQLR